MTIFWYICYPIWRYRRDVSDVWGNCRLWSK